MGRYTDSQLEAFSLATGVRPAEGDHLIKLQEVQRLAFEIIKLAERELAGIRDGDGYWYGSDPLHATISDLCGLWRPNRSEDAQRLPKRP